MDIKRLEEMAHQAGDQNGCRLYDFYKHRDRLQIFIDKPNYEINLKDCENVFHSFKFLIRSEFPEVLEQKRLEISSPGLEKSLRKTWHFEEVIGKTIKVVTSSPMTSIDDKRDRPIQSQSVTAELKSISDEKIELEEIRGKWSIPFSQIKSAHIVIPFLKKSEPNQKKNNKLKKRRK